MTVFGQSIFGPDFGALPPIVAVLICASLLQDAWKLRVARDSAQETAGKLAIASAAGLAVMIGVIIALAWFGVVTGLTMAAAFLTMCGVRLIVHVALTALSRGGGRWSARG